MENKKLLNRYKIKLSLFFAVFVMLCFYLIQGIFLTIQYFENKNDLENFLLKKLIWVENIIKNKENYYSQIENENNTLQKILLKTLENTIIYENNTKIVDFSKDINWIDIENIWFFDYKDKKILISTLNFQNNNYKIILNEINTNNYKKFLWIYMYFIIYSLPFFIIFYLLWYFIIWKYFKAINQSIEALEDFTSNVNHEMKTPISEIISTLSLAKEIKNYDEAIEISLNSTLKLNKILDSIIWIANLSDLSYKKERINLIWELNLIIKDFENELSLKKINIVFQAKPKIFIKKINKEHFYICVKNLLSNAIKYSNENSKIEIFFDNWILSITDYWIWIDKENLKNIFKRYFRENYLEKQWLWIWLNLVKKITEINNWKIDIESQKNVYSKFSINFN